MTTKREDQSLSAAPAAMPVEPVVKPLEWVEGPPGTYTEIAESPFGHYSVWEINGTGCWAPWKQGSGTIADGGLAGAKAAAQADYEARIRSALAAQPKQEPVAAEQIAAQACAESHRDHGNIFGGSAYDCALRAARIALATPPAPAVADGWVLVPREMTEAMLNAASRAVAENDGETVVYDVMAEAAFNAALAASPAPATPAEVEQDHPGEEGLWRFWNDKARELQAALTEAKDRLKGAEEARQSMATAYQKYLDASALYNERLAIAKTKALGTMRVDEEWKAIDEARRAFDALCVEIARAALTTIKGGEK